MCGPPLPPLLRAVAYVAPIQAARLNLNLVLLLGQAFSDGPSLSAPFSLSVRPSRDRLILIQRIPVDRAFVDRGRLPSSSALTPRSRFFAT